MMVDSSLPDKDWEEGAALLFRAQDGDPAQIEALRIWIGDDPLRAEAIRRLQQTWASFAQAGHHPDIQALRTAALDMLGGHTRRTVRRRFMLAAACAAVLVLPGGLWLNRATHIDPSVVTNMTDAVRTVRLADGSLVALDRYARLDVLFSGSKRMVTLRRGQARFEVAHDADRPFHVMAHGRDIRALGTDFNVDMQDTSVAISLIRGRVAVSRAVQRKNWLGLFDREKMFLPVTLGPGQQLFVPDKGRMEMRYFQPQEVTAWQHGKLIINNRPLEQVVAAVNRYATPKIRLDRTVTPGLRISGGFSVRDGAAFADNLTMLFPDLVIRRDGNVLVLSASESRQKICSGC